MKIPFLGGFHKDKSVSFNAQRTVNLYSELDPTGKDVLAMYMTPGLELAFTLDTAPVRGLRGMGDYLYAVGGNIPYKVDTSHTAAALGTIGTSSGAVSMSDNGTQLILLDGSLGYTYNTSTSVFAQITDVDFLGGSIVDFVDTYLVVGPQGRQSFQISNANDATAWTSSDTAPAEAQPDSLITLLAMNRHLWLFGDWSTEVFWNSGASFPFERLEGGFMEMGCAAKFSPVKVDNSVLWLTKNRDGQGQIARADGIRPVIVSNRALEAEIAGYSTISDAIAFAYQQEGHTFYQITFPTAGKTWVYDLSIQDPDLAWHQRESFVSGVSLGRHIANCHAFWKGYHYVGDYRNGNVYRFKTDVYTENGEYILWERTGQYIHDDRRRLSFSRFELDAETGVGLVSGQGSDPQVYLDWSDDGGKTWSNKLGRSLGAIGAHRIRVYWNKLGACRGPKGRVFRLTGSDPVKTAFFAAMCDIK